MPHAVRWFTAAAFLLVLASPTLAHNMRVDTFLRADQVRVEVSFDDDTPGDQAPVVVRDAAGTVIASGKTDDTGVWHFPRPKPGQYTVRVEYIGHDKEVTLPIADEAATGEFQSWQPNKVAGVVVGLTLLALVVLIFRFRQKRRHGT